MAKPNLSAYEYFQLFAPRFYEVKWELIGFSKHKHSHKLHLAMAGKEGLIWTRVGSTSFDLQEAKVRDFSYTYNPDLELGPLRQCAEAAFKAVMAGPLAGRKFYLKSRKESAELFFKDLVENRRPLPIAADLSNSGPEILGLHFSQEVGIGGWEFLIPKDSNEGKIIDAAVQLEQGKRISTKLRLGREQVFPTVEDRAANLKQALAALAA